ncbi:hypothetical protein CLU79DRAFT_890096 [Phycomyces nitens]|nr:hypothetical protein CLU79DRAFT_890096 [Phycomyces nitens]
MLLSKFPREIIQQFTELLSLEDKISCYLVCKSWKELFQDSLHSDLLVYRPLLEDLVDPPQDSQPPCLKTRLLVRNLEIGYHTLTTDEELYVLQQTFPNIKYLHFEPDSIIPDNFGVTADWNIWRSLAELHIPFDQTHVPDIENTLVKIILCLPLLRRLQILNRDTSKVRVSFSLDDFETIHSHLKHLGYWEFSSNLLALSETDIECMTKVSPATNMRSMNIFSENTDHRWLCYFARKYPNLHTLSFSTSNILSNVNTKRSATISLFQKVPLPFQHLTKLNMNYHNWTGKDHLLFWDIIHFYNMPLKHVSVKIDVPYGTTYPDNPCDIPKHVTEVCLAELSSTIESFHLDCPGAYSTPIDLTEIKNSLNNLVELNIRPSASVEIDTLLCAAPRLRTIELANSDITTKDKLYNSNRFELQSFTSWRTYITSDVLRFLSFHCRSLNELDLRDTSVCGNFTTPGCQFIDMTYTRLKKLYLENTVFVIQDSKRSRKNLSITLITRPIEDITPKQDYDPNVLPVVVGGPPVKACYEWFHADGSNTMWDISPAKGSRVQKFVSNYEENKKITFKRALDAKKRKPYKSWNNNCVFGYTKIKLGYVADFEIEYSLDYICKSWKELFQDSLHSDLLVYRPLLEDLVDPSQDSQPPCLKTRLLVRNLEIDYLTLTTDEELYVLQQTFPNIKYLHFEPDSIIPDNFGVTADWNIWRSLTELHIPFDQTHIPDIENTLVKIILCLPLLRRLQIINRDTSKVRVSFSLDDFETIHSHLKHLGYWEFSSNLLGLSETDIERMTKVSPATKMRNLDITSKNADHRWLCYFARKYPNLHTLSFSTSNLLPNVNEKRSATVSLFQQVPLPFQHLTKLNVNYRNWTGKDHLLFWDIIHFHNMPLKHVSVDINVPYGTTSPNNLCDIPKHITEVCLAEFSKTIESFYLRCPSTFSVPIDLAEIKNSLNNLVELNIFPSTSVEIDTLLCATPRLRTIELGNSDITIKDKLYNSNRFGLQTFKLWRADITSDVLRFLSFHCRSLDELNLKNLSVYGNFTTPGCQFIDMTYTRLEKFYLESTVFIIQDNKRYRKNLDITLITRPIDDCTPKQDYDPNILPVVVGGSPVKACYEWFYTDEPDSMWDISTAKGSRVQKFVSNYEENKRITFKRALDAKKRKPYKSWNSNCVFGYTKIKLGYVADFHIKYSIDYSEFYPNC